MPEWYWCWNCRWKGFDPTPKLNMLGSKKCPMCGLAIHSYNDEERAAIMEYDGNMSREEAERRVEDETHKR